MIGNSQGEAEIPKLESTGVWEWSNDPGAKI
jgi:hypothetical protein